MMHTEGGSGEVEEGGRGEVEEDGRGEVEARVPGLAPDADGGEMRMLVSRGQGRLKSRVRMGEEW